MNQNGNQKVEIGNKINVGHSILTELRGHLSKRLHGCVSEEEMRDDSIFQKRCFVVLPDILAK